MRRINELFSESGFFKDGGIDGAVILGRVLSGRYKRGCRDRVRDQAGNQEKGNEADEGFTHKGVVRCTW